MTDTTDTTPETLTVTWNGHEFQAAKLTPDQLMILPTVSLTDVVPTIQTIVKILKYSVGPAWERISDDWVNPDVPLGVQDIMALFQEILEGSTERKEKGSTVACPVCSAGVPLPSLAEHINLNHASA